MSNKTAYAVIGANLGDEGKGLTTDYLCYLSKGPTTVVRFNGGAQAGHTVTTSNTRHVFHHYSSGSFLDADTYLSKDFICNPILFMKEKRKFLGNGTPNFKVIADPRCLVTTPWDMMINQIIEERRGLSRHGSCGVGINETVVRNEKPEYHFTLSNILDAMSADTHEVSVKLEKMQREWVWFRLAQLGIKECDLTSAEMYNLLSFEIKQHFLDDLDTFRQTVHMTKPEYFQAYKGQIIFEGAQGLALDQNAEDFPYVTRSNTGLKNVIPLCKEMGIEVLKPVYVTRPYLTRHGQGPLPNELPGAPWDSVIDNTNIPNKWQGMLRFGWIDESKLSLRINEDLENARLQAGKDLKIEPTIMLTCVDQIPGGLEQGYVRFSNDDIRHSSSVPEFLTTLGKRIGAKDRCYVSLGPTRKDVLPLDQVVTVTKEKA